MASILIFSENHQFFAKCAKVLACDHQVDRIKELNEECHADIIVIDTDILDRNDRILEQISHHPALFLLTGSQWPEEKQVDAIIHSAAGYYDLADPDIMLQKAITHILQGDIWVHRRMVPKVIHSLIANRQAAGTSEDKHHAKGLLNNLSNREMDVANMIGEGKSNKHIALALNISERTVKAHLTSIFRKLNISDRLHLAILLKETS